MADVSNLAGGATVTWKGGELEEAIRKQYALRLKLVCEMVKTQVQRNISSPSRPTPSSPGEFPHADTGVLRNSIFASVDEEDLSGTVGTALRYGLYLEFGTSGGQIVRAAPGSVLSWIDPHTGERRFAKWIKLGPIAPRPFLRRTLREMMPKITAAFTKRLPNFQGALYYAGG